MKILIILFLSIIITSSTYAERKQVKLRVGVLDVLGGYNQAVKDGTLVKIVDEPEKLVVAYNDGNTAYQFIGDKNNLTEVTLMQFLPQPERSSIGLHPLRRQHTR